MVDIKRLGPATLVVAFSVLILALLLDGGVSEALPGLSYPGSFTLWTLPLTKVVLHGSAATTIGLLGLAVALPARNRELTGEALAALRAASWSALVWALAAGTLLLLTLSDQLGRPVSEVFTGNAMGSYISSVASGRAYTATFLLALAIIPAARLLLTYRSAFTLLTLGLGALIPLGLIGHSSAGDYHNSATVALLVHLIAMAVWVGGLAALIWYASKRPRYLARAAQTFSVTALGAFALLAASGVMNAFMRFPSLDTLFTTSYGLTLLGKIAGFTLLGYIGYLHRRHTIAAMSHSSPGKFTRLAAGELLIMAAVVGLSVALTRTEPPLSEVPETISPVRDLLGYPLPPEISAANIVSQFYPDALFALGCFSAVALYGVGVWKLRRRGDRWPIGRTVSWMLGVATIAFVQLSGLMTYGMTMLSVHMTQHMTLMMLSPVLLVLGAPTTLALRAIRPAQRGETGPRELIIAVVNSSFLRLLTHPLIAFALFTSGSFIVYFTGLFEAAMRNHAGHMLMSVHFLLVGYLFFEVLIGVDPLPKRPPFPARIVMQLVSMAFHAIFGLALMESSRLIAGDFYRQLNSEISWLPDTLVDQTRAGEITWGFGELPGLLVIIVIFVQWYRSDDREARRFDKKEESSQEQERMAYNAYLSDLHERSR